MGWLLWQTFLFLFPAYPYLYIFQMKTFKYNINGRELCIRVGGEEGTITDFLVDGKYPQIIEEKMPVYAAVISLALLEHDVEVVHDDEPGVITLQSSRSTWGSPASLPRPTVGSASSAADSTVPTGDVF